MLAWLILFNATAFALLAGAAVEGYVHLALSADTSGVVIPAILAVWAVGLTITVQEALKVHFGFGHLSRWTVLFLRHINTSLILLGLIGTVVGFIVALSGVDPDSVADVSKIGPMVSTLISGMAIALYSTLVGSLAWLWQATNVVLLVLGAGRDQ